jgi:hypothetical protein
MPKLQPDGSHCLVVRRDRPLIGVPVDDGDGEAVCYFADEQVAGAALGRDRIRRALSLAGAWRSLDSDDALDELDRIRHESRPTPPVDFSDI